MCRRVSTVKKLKSAHVDESIDTKHMPSKATLQHGSFPVGYVENSPCNYGQTSLNGDSILITFSCPPGALIHANIVTVRSDVKNVSFSFLKGHGKLYQNDVGENISRAISKERATDQLRY